VRKCKSKETGTQYAVKIIRSEDEEMYIHMQREYRILESLNGHPNIIQGIEYIPEVGRCRGYLIMELVQGTHILQKIASEGAMSEPKAREVFKSIIEALDYMHERRVVHRDFNPTNVFITEDGGIKILDFNVSKLIESEQNF
jgi:serine/threonine protein kinase